MKNTGIVRRIDELGRIVIPKEIRKILRLHEGTQMEIYTGDEGELLLKKFSHISEVKNYADNFAKSLAENYEKGVLICDNDKVLSVHNLTKKEYIQKPISAELDKLMRTRKSYYYKASDTHKVVPVIVNDSHEYTSQIIVPIISSSDIVGAIIVVSKDEQAELITENVKTVQTLSTVLANIIS